VHGVAVDRIVVAIAADRLAPDALEALLEVEKTSDIALQFLSERLGFDDRPRKSSVLAERERTTRSRQKALALNQDVDDLGAGVNPFWIRKRIVDVFAAATLMIVLTPIIGLVALAVALDVGFPVIFWQKRPGLHGRPFRVIKFRTMHAPYDKSFRRVSDEQRQSSLGRFLRRTRLDELPQLYNVLKGDMSFVGPRPLLPCDQSPEYAARLSVRPGITGWAQINGGRIITAGDKAILDIWYVGRASFMLDLRIVLGTVRMVLFGDQFNTDVVSEARRDLSRLPGIGSMAWSEIAAPAE
jgi:lipopolysaccharide/colanic/teichoic acid biosynthesis glycosyltransferase